GGDSLKTSWPEVVGLGLLLAARKIRGDQSAVRLEVHKVGDAVEPGHDDTRVRIFVNIDATYTVALTPFVG
ncbi:hypothetical protein PVAP13_1NG044108, partial [Panicum virgatum]